MSRELWAVEAKHPGACGKSDPIVEFDLAYTHKQAREVAMDMRLRGLKVWAWDMMNKGGQFDLAK